MAAYQTPQEWLESLSAEERAQAERKIALLERFGADNPVGWVALEMQEDIPQVACFLYLHEIRDQLLDRYSYDGREERVADRIHPREAQERGEAAYQRLLDAGVDPKDIAEVTRGEVSRTIWDLLCLMSGALGSEYDAIEDAPRWVLAEVAGPPGEEKLTGRCLNNLHTNFFHLYPEDRNK